MISTVKKDQKNKDRISLAVVSIVGGARGALCLLVEHPFDTLKTWMQSSNQSARNGATQIYTNKGWKGFYSGFRINLLRVVTKQAYRWPLNIYLITQFRQILKKYDYHNALAGFATGAFIAIIESVIICPFQRIKIWMMTTRKINGYQQFVQAMALKNIFDGYLPVLVRQLVSWVSFLGSTQTLKQMIYRHKGKSRAEYALNMYQLAAVSIIVCFINTFFVMPVDYVKTHYQKYQESGDKDKKISLTKFISKTYQEGGIQKFYRGSGIKIIYYNINSLLTVAVFEKMLRKYDY